MRNVTGFEVVLSDVIDAIACILTVAAIGVAMWVLKF